MSDGFLKFLTRWIPFILYCVAILTLSSMPEVPGASRFPDKLEHLVEYFIFALLLHRALVGKSFFGVLVSGALFAAFDEFYQSYIPGRTSSVYDWIADVAGILILLTLSLVGRRRKEHSAESYEVA